ncbi:hypothetical protein [Phenylobacterium sp.]|uniref:hypothetical protein n=1 Tax=Phenylobacterium sp. TaxID=1871053 RepID=UPI0025E5B40A|nr:hypothetical protein [Phenylobacterium sp.]
MSSGLTYTGAIARGLAYPPAPPPPAADQAYVSAARLAAPVSNPAEAREQTRDQIMAEQGVDPVSLFRLGAQDRLRAETAIMVETALRDLKAQNQQRADVRAAGTLIDLRV